MVIWARRFVGACAAWLVRVVMAATTPDKRAIFKTATACTTDADYIAALGATGMLQVSTEHFLPAALPSSQVLTTASGGATVDVDWCFVDCALLRVCDLRTVFRTLGHCRLTLYPATASRIMMELLCGLCGRSRGD